MIRKVCFSILIALLTACNSGSGGASGNTDRPAPLEAPPCVGCQPVTSQKWGSAPCQERGTCDIQLLNVSKNRLVNFYNRHFKSEMNFSENPEYQCGRHLSLQLEGYFNEVDFSKEDNKAYFVRLSSFILDPVKCVIRRPIEQAIDLYFKELPSSAIR